MRHFNNTISAGLSFLIISLNFPENVISCFYQGFELRTGLEIEV